MTNLESGKKILLTKYPEWSIFIDELFIRLEKLNQQSEIGGRARFIHLLGSNNTPDAKTFFRDLFDALGAKRNSVFLEFKDDDSPGIESRILGRFLKKHRKFPPYVFTDLLGWFYYYTGLNDYCDLIPVIRDWMIKRQTLYIPELCDEKSYPDNSLIISYSDFLYNREYRVQAFLMFLEKTKEVNLDGIFHEFFPDQLEVVEKLGVISRDETVLFASNNDRTLLWSISLFRVSQEVEKEWSAEYGLTISIDLSILYNFTKNHLNDIEDIDMIRPRFKEFISKKRKILETIRLEPFQIDEITLGFEDFDQVS